MMGPLFPTRVECPLHLPGGVCQDIAFLSGCVIKLKGATGPPNAFCWRMGSGAFVTAPVASGLVLNPNSEIHGTVQPDSPMLVNEYQNKLAATRDQWVIDED
jgi:hypothetical protein